MPFVMNQDIPETYEELKQAFIAEYKERYENNEHSQKLLGKLISGSLKIERDYIEQINELKAQIACQKKEIRKLTNKNTDLKEMFDETVYELVLSLRKGKNII